MEIYQILQVLLLKVMILCDFVISEEAYEISEVSDPLVIRQLDIPP